MRGIPPIPEAQVRRFLLLALLAFAIALVPVAARTSPSARAVTPDETFTTVAGATARVWSGTPLALGTTGGTLPAQVSAVFEWSNGSQAFKFWFRGFPLNFNTLATLNTDGYYFFQAATAVPVTILGSANYAMPAVGQFTTVAGGATGQLWTGGSPATLDSLPGAISAIFEWANESQAFKFWFRGFPPSFNTLSTVQAGRFYFFQSSAAANVAVKLVDRVEIDQTGLLFTQSGQTRQLSVQAFDAQGTVLTIPIIWASTSSSVSISATGMASAQTNSGTSQVTALAGGVKSAPLLVLVTQPAPGAVLLTDGQIVGTPVETTPGAPPSFDNTYQVTLTGVAAPAIGTVLINTGSSAVAGRVVAVQSAGGQHTVTLQLLSLREMFPTLNLTETMDLSRAQLSIAPALSAAYDITRTGNTVNFAPKPGPARAPIGTSALPPFTNCETSLPSLPMTLSAPPIFSATLNLGLDLVVTSANGLERFVITGAPAFKVEGGITATAAFEAKVECKVELLVLRIPVGGPLSLVLGGLVPVGVGFEVGGKVTVASVGLKTAADVGITNLLAIQRTAIEQAIGKSLPLLNAQQATN